MLILGNCRGRVVLNATSTSLFWPTMPPKGTSATTATRSSTRTRASPSDQTVPAPVRATRSAKVASIAAGTSSSTVPQTSSKTRAAAATSEITTKRLRPLSDRNGTVAPKPTKPVDKNPAAMLAATKKALRPVTTGKQEDREPIKVCNILDCHLLRNRRRLD